MSNRRHILDHTFSAADRLFFDANIWIYINGPQGSPGDKRPAVYSKALQNAIQGKSKIFIDVLVISEFINRFARIEYDMWNKQNSKQVGYKEFRNNPVFLPIAQSIIRNVRTIMKFCISLESGFTKINLDRFLSDFESSGHDFNDQIILNLCQMEGLTLVSHDGDFKNKDVDILTANKMLL